MPAKRQKKRTGPRRVGADTDASAKAKTRWRGTRSKHHLANTSEKTKSPNGTACAAKAKTPPQRRRQKPLIPSTPINLPDHRQPIAPSPNILQDHVDGALRPSSTSNMRRNPDPRMRPKRMRLRQWLRIRHIKNGILQLPAIERIEQILLINLRAAPDINERRPFGQLAEQTLIEQPTRRIGKRQQADKNIRPSKKRIERLDTRKTFNTL
jgi:hypothetical protein